MEVILREHVDNVGRRGEIVKVADGFARNYLLPRKLALPATPGNKKHVEREEKKFEVREAEARAQAEATLARLGDLECVIARKLGEADVLYGSVTVKYANPLQSSTNVDVTWLYVGSKYAAVYAGCSIVYDGVSISMPVTHGAYNVLLLRPEKAWRPL